jgi:hypothetical protein
MIPEHRIIPRPPAQRNPLHHPTFLGLFLFLGLFAFFSILLLSSKLHPIGIQGHADYVAAGVRITNSTNFTCDYNFVRGTNMLGIPCLPLNTPIADFVAAFSGNGNNVGSIYAYNPRLTQQWEVYKRVAS